MKINKWTLGLAAAGVVSLGSVAQAEEASEHLMTAVSGTQISGYVSTSASWMSGSGSRLSALAPAGAAILPGRGFHDNGAKQDGFNLDVIDLTISKSLDEGEWAAGYKAEVWFGPDAVAYGSSSTGINDSDINIRQAYVELRAPVGNGLDFKVGVFDTIIGYELSNHDANPNFGRSYGWGLEPTSHTGILASYKVTDFLSFSAGVANNGLNNQINARQPVESDKSYMAGIFLTAPEDMGFLSGATLSAGVVESTLSSTGAAAVFSPLPGANTSDIINYYVGVALPLPIEGWSVGASYDYRGQSSDNNNAAANYANAVALYLSAGVTEKLKINLRADYTSATGGTYYTVLGTDNDPNNKLFALTTTVDYSLWENVISRLEVRWDTALTGETPFGDSGFGSAAVNGEGDKNAITVALNLIYKF